MTGQRYVELPPPAHLRPYVRCFWASRNGPQVRTHLVFPDGCTDIIATDTTLHVAGPMTTTERVPLAPDAIVAGVRFLPGAASAALGVSVAELVDDNPALSALWGRRADDLLDRTALATARERLAALADAITVTAPPDRIAVAAGNALTRRPDLPLSGMARSLGISDRQLRRRMEEAVGYSPRTLARIMRFQHFLVASESSCDLAELAITAGYSDQPHLTRECKAFTGLTPRALINR